MLDQSMGRMRMRGLAAIRRKNRKKENGAGSDGTDLDRKMWDRNIRRRSKLFADRGADAGADRWKDGKIRRWEDGLRLGRRLLRSRNQDEISTSIIIVPRRFILPSRGCTRFKYEGSWNPSRHSPQRSDAWRNENIWAFMR